jgi:hypothetical protein
MLTKKSAYSGFKMHKSPILILKNCSILKDSQDSDNITSFEKSFCQLCHSVKGDEMYINYNRPFASVNLASPCCESIMCPNCAVINKNDHTVIIHDPKRVK